MDNAELLKGMGFELVAGELWMSAKMGYITVKPDTGLEEIASMIFNKGYMYCQSKFKELMDIKNG